MEVSEFFIKLLAIILSAKLFAEVFSRLRILPCRTERITSP